MITRNVGSDSRTVIIGAFAVIMILAVGRGSPSIKRWQDTAIQMTRLELQQRRRDVELADQLPALREQWHRAAELTARLDSAEISAVTPIAAGARLMAVINELADDTGIEVNTARLEDHRQEREQSSRAIVSVQLTGGLEDLVVFLSSLEAGPPAIAVTDFSIAPSAGPSVSGAGRLQVALTVEAPVRRAER